LEADEWEIDVVLGGSQNVFPHRRTDFMSIAEMHGMPY